MTTTNNYYWNCNFGSSMAGTWHGSTWYCNTPSYRTKAQYKAKAPLGSGFISQLAQKADDLGLKAKCFNDEETAFLEVVSFNTSKVNELDKYAKEIGFKPGEVDIEGESCPCYL